MKKWAFVSDFDGTISKEDFYKMVMNRYYSEGEERYKQWKNEEILDIEFLSDVFTSIDQEEEQILSDILTIPIDEYVPTFINHVQNQGGDFYILSAGTDYYIYQILQQYGIKDVKVFSNEGYYHEKNIHMKIDKKHPHYSERYGIDKSKVILELKEQYDTLYFAGDSEPDSHPAQYADVTYAKDALQDLLREKGISFVPVQSFEEIEQDLKARGVLS
ncbi:MtnX-like HAD-IB family phosphatase [Bacillus luteolus]|uniref:MtnX-like HAD-IB family phosphatase n=1 Tax=Litchfieldia luteola TaxID=682179 RepID=A0ABR9QP43_9BACI|nr:MtnX-like HAD-IB family phosphatase [Cytobacillus luteolus]MBE4909944.1 MtnX-like HAD-IB family phosphatase [Cytobacillus luteolus]MBP1942500.1 2,3-diketo-5-methylthio-1-phosphopentane phosphatase [Cytobacillus luteolus]